MLRCPALVFVLALAVPVSDSAAQRTTYWRVPASVGGAMIGAGAGWAADIVMWQDENCGFCGPTLIMTPVGIGAGAVVGWVVGRKADMRLARGDSLSEAGRFWLRFTTFLTPVAVGSLATFLIVNPRDDECGGLVPSPGGGTQCRFTEPPKKFASDATVALVGIGGGVVLGYLAQKRFTRALNPRVMVGPGDAGLSFSATF